MAISGHSKQLADKHEMVLDKHGFDAVVLLSKDEIECCQEILSSGNVKASWVKYMSKHSCAKEETYYQCSHHWSKRADVQLYIQYLKASVGTELRLSTDLIAKKLAVSLHVNLSHFIHKDGSRRRLNEISEMALSGAKVKMKFNQEGLPTGNTEIELPSITEVLSSLSKLADVDADLVQSLKTKVAKQKVKLTRK